MLLQARQLGLAADEGREVLAGIKALGALRRHLFVQPVHRLARVKALELRDSGLQAEGKALTGNQPRGLGHQHTIGPGMLLQPRRMVHGGAHRLGVADHHPAGGNADAHLQAQIAKLAGQAQPGAQRLRGGVLAGHGVAEVAHKAVVALRVVGQAAVGLGGVGHAAVVVGQALAVLLIAQAVHQVGGADQIDRQDGDLAQVVGQRGGTRGQARGGGRHTGTRLHRGVLAIAIQPGGGGAAQAGPGGGAGALGGDGKRRTLGQCVVERGGGRWRRGIEHQGTEAGAAGGGHPIDHPIGHRIGHAARARALDHQQARAAGQVGELGDLLVCGFVCGLVCGLRAAWGGG